MPEELSIEDKLQACINTLLREEYPFTYPSIINNVAYETAALAASMIVQRKKACKQGVRLLQFMDLPPELRNRIHEYTVQSHERCWEETTDIHICYDFQIFAALQPAITKVSRQLRRETLAMFYATNSFVVELDRLNTDEQTTGKFPAISWLGTIGAVNRAHIKNFTIRYIPGSLRVPLEQLLSETDLSLVADIAKVEVRSAE
ncbi:hypothetical protein LTR17_014828 [Elasticomyces elasticus]|nr:hypothetical protein LTR17_014828 [Elasticomyces elasticus]